MRLFTLRTFFAPSPLLCASSHLSGSSSPRQLSVTREFGVGIELNWLPPAEPNGEVLHYVIEYTPEGDTEQSIGTGSNLTYYNLTGLERNRVYTNIAVQAVNSAGRSDRSEVITQYIYMQPGECLRSQMQCSQRTAGKCAHGSKLPIHHTCPGKVSG